MDVTAGKKWMLLQGRSGCYCREEEDVTAGKKWMLLQGRSGCYCREEEDVTSLVIGNLEHDQLV